MVLGNCLQEVVDVSLTGLSPSMVGLSRAFSYITICNFPVVTDLRQPHNPCNAVACYSRFGLFPVRSPLLRESRLISFPGGTEMFHFPPFAFHAYEFSTDDAGLPAPGFPIRKSPDQSLFAAPRSLSQLTTSFIAS